MSKCEKEGWQEYGPNIKVMTNALMNVIFNLVRK